MAKSISLDEAFAVLIREAGEADQTHVSLPEACGHILAQPAHADRDLPAFDRAMVDGFALRSVDTPSSSDGLQIIDEVYAGQRPAQSVASGTAVRIMTGAPVPQGADAVVMHERTTSPQPQRVVVPDRIRPEANIARRASDVRAGDRVLEAGTRIGPAEVGILATLGISAVPVRRKPRLAILGTGDEIVEPDKTPTPSQIRNSNSYQLLAQAASHGLDAHYLGLAPDDPAATRTLLEKGLASDVLITTGGVSAGAKDYVQASLLELGVQLFFTRVEVKPGKPTVFGRRGSTLVFGLPGNPVAALVCFHLFVMTALRKRMGMPDALPKHVRLPLQGVAPPAGDRPTYRPARLVYEVDTPRATAVRALEWHGSGDLAACAGADGFILQAAGQTLADGETVSFFPLPAVV